MYARNAGAYVHDRLFVGKNSGRVTGPVEARCDDGSDDGQSNLATMRVTAQK